MNYLDYLNYGVPKYQSPWGTLKTIPRRLGQKVQYWKNRIFGTHEGELEGIKKLEGEGTDVVSLDKGVLRVTPDTEQRGTLFNEFVENPENKTIRTASKYKKLKEDENATVSDREIPVSNINLFAGIQDGHFVIDSLPNFNDTTTVIPVRNIKKDTPLISELYLPKSPDYGVSEEDMKRASIIYEDHWKRRPRYRSNNLYYNIEKKLGRKPTFEELQNLAKRWYLSHWTYKKEGNEYELPEDINSLISPLSEDENTIFSNIATSRHTKLLDQNSIVFDKFLGAFKTQNRIPVLLSMASNLYIDRDKPRNDIDLHNDSILYSLVNPKQKDIDKYMEYKKQDWEPYNKAKSIRDQYFSERKGPKNLQGLQVITPEGDTIPIGNYNAGILDKKMVLGNPKGGMFIADFKNLSQQQLDEQVNPYLKENPSWLYMPDMGSYSLYGLQNGIDPKMLKTAKRYGFDVNTKPTYSTYWNQFTESESKAPYNPDVHYLVGVKKRGGKLNYLNYIN